ncbi:MAG: hypothetical protein FJY88_03745 [Candidatus Eisenbacteria bacterium]|nr:hypothetical protein [Candidatus Eisenbacteria bacterium]
MLEERVHRMEADLERLEGVRLARMRVADGEIIEIHIVADAARKPKGIARDVVTALFALHGIRVPHQRVSVAATRPDSGEGCGSAAPGVVVSLAQLASAGQTYHSIVELRRGGRTTRAGADALATRANRNRVVALAALRAAGDMAGGALPLHLEDVRILRLGRTPFALVHLVHLSGEEERPLVGCRAADTGLLEAIAGAVVDAVGAIAEWPGVEEDLEYEVREDHLR